MICDPQACAATPEAGVHFEAALRIRSDILDLSGIALCRVYALSNSRLLNASEIRCVGLKEGRSASALTSSTFPVPLKNV